MPDFTTVTQTPSAPQPGQKVPRQSINELYLQKTLDAIGQYGYILTTYNGHSDPRQRLMCRYIINLVLDDDIRHMLLIEFDKQISVIYKGNMSVDEKWELVAKLSADFVGEVVGYLDVFLNLHQQNYIEEA